MNVYMTARFYTRTDKHSSTHIVSARVEYTVPAMGINMRVERREWVDGRSRSR